MAIGAVNSFRPERYTDNMRRGRRSHHLVPGPGSRQPAQVDPTHAMGRAPRDRHLPVPTALADLHHPGVERVGDPTRAGRKEADRGSTASGRMRCCRTRLFVERGGQEPRIRGSERSKFRQAPQVLCGCLRSGRDADGQVGAPSVGLSPSPGSSDGFGGRLDGWGRLGHGPEPWWIGPL